MKNQIISLKSFIEDLNNRISLSSVVRDQVALTKKGREYQGLCPFHTEKTPSFYVNDEKGFYHCFGCGAHGDSIGFIELSQKIPFKDALEILAQKCGLEVPPSLWKQESTTDKEEYEVLYKCLYEAAAFYYRNLVNAQQGTAYKYLMSRGITSEDIRNFGLGYAPFGAELETYLETKGFARKIIADCGFIVNVETENRQYSRFRNRLMFPIWNPQNHIVAFGGRSLGDDMPKYMNSPESLVFHKGKILYGLNKALKSNKKDSFCIVCEGYMDVIKLHKIGLTQSVAPLGTAISEEQILLLWKYWKEIVFCFDGDNAGIMAAERAIERAMPYVGADRSVKILILPKGEDPDSLITKHGNLGFLENLEKSIPLSEYLWLKKLEKYGTQTPESLVGMKKDLLQVTNLIHDPLTAKAYSDYFSNKFLELKKGIPLNNKRSATFVSAKTFQVPTVLLDHLSILAGSLLKAIYLKPILLSHVTQHLYELDFHDHGAQELRDVYLNSLEMTEDWQQWHKEISKNLSNEALKILQDPRMKIHTIKFERLVPIEVYIAAWNEMLHNFFTLKNLEIDLKKAQDDLNNDMSSENWNRLKTLQQMVISLRQQKSSDI